MYIQQWSYLSHMNEGSEKPVSIERMDFTFNTDKGTTGPLEECLVYND